MFMDVTVTIPKKEIEEMLKKQVVQQFGREVKKVTFHTSVVTTGYGLAERNEFDFDKVTVELGEQINRWER